MSTNQPPILPHQSLAIFGLAFRPLFLVASIFAFIAIGWWTFYWTNPFAWSPYGGVIWWHAHEMLFGFGIAVVTGFLLTAVKNWTGVAGISGLWLAGLVSIWLLGRLLMAFSGNLAHFYIMAVDVSYLLFAAVAMAYPIIKVKQWRNIMFVPILLILAGLNASSHWAVMNHKPQLAIHALHATIMLFILIITIIGGRVIPMFTANGIGIPRKASIFLIEITSIVSTASLAIIAFIGFDQIGNYWLFSSSLVATISQFIRLSRWGGQHSGANPLVWSLHLAYLFIPIGFLLLVLFALGLVNNLSAILHSFTLGAIGGMILSMITRVALGHTGRPLKTTRLIKLAFALIFLAAIIRVSIPILFTQGYQLGIETAGILWVISFAIYVFVFLPILIRPRVDGRAG